MDDTGLYVLPCRIPNSVPFDTLADLCSCINILPLSIYKSLNLGKLENTKMRIGLAYRSVVYPLGSLKDVEVHIERWTVLADFYVIDITEDPACPLLVGREFLATTSVIIDYRKSKIAVDEGYTRSVYVVKNISMETMKTRLGKFKIGDSLMALIPRIS